ncbi:MAG: bifunctional enoyl-CoA hydratase/phosphate acetyltransferase [Rhodospirillales bacterium]
MLSTVPFEIPRYLAEMAKDLPSLPMAVAGADNRVALESAKMVAESGLVAPILVGDPAEIRAIAQDIGWDLAGIRIVAADSEDAASEKAVALARGGEAALLMKGHVHTDSLMRAVINRDTGLRTGRRTSHVFHMTIPRSDKVLYITDAAINVAPDVGVKMDILQNAIDMVHALGLKQPHVAVLSGAEVVNTSMPSSVEADELVKRAAGSGITGAIIDGPLAFDNAVSLEAAQIKGIDSPVAGKADILLVPNLESGNFLFKQMVYFMSATAAGVVMGAKVPIVLTSRADPPEARFASAAVAVLVAAANENA